MMSHQEWFRDLRTPDQPGYIETGDDTLHPIRHIGDVPFGKQGEQTQAGTRIPQCRYESMRVEADLGYHPKPTRLELEGAC